MQVNAFYEEKKKYDEVKAVSYKWAMEQLKCQDANVVNEACASITKMATNKFRIEVKADTLQKMNRQNRKQYQNLGQLEKLEMKS